MSASAEGASSTTKAVVSDQTNEPSKDQQKPATALEEDDEFEDFPVDGMAVHPSLSYAPRES